MPIVRRSTRGQPLPVEAPGQYVYDWDSPELFRCAAEPRDMGRAELIADQNELDGLEACYYSSFVRKPDHADPSRDMKKKKKSQSKQKSVALEKFRVGDTVLVHTSAADLPSVAAITAILEILDLEGRGVKDNGLLGIQVRVHWFTTARQLATIRPHRDELENEVYYTASLVSTISPNAIIGPCTVINPKSVANQRKSSTVMYATRYSLEGAAYKDFNWEEHRVAVLANPKRDIRDDTIWNVKEEASDPRPPKRGRKSRRIATRREADESVTSESEGENSEDAYEDGDADSDPSEGEQEAESSEKEQDMDVDEDVEAEMPSSPRKRKRKVAGSKQTQNNSSTKRKRENQASQRRFKIRPMGVLTSGKLDHLPRDPFQRVIHALHVGSRPEVLSCREDEYADVLGAVLGMLEDDSGGCIYISGVPGTGKTATVYAAVKELREMAVRGETRPFTYAEINGLKLPDPPSAYRVLWEAVSRHDTENEGHLSISNKQALRNLTKYFTRGGAGPGDHTCVVLMDELDQLMTAKQDVVYNFFNWPSVPESDVKLVVIAVANTHDLPERAMSGRVRSRIGMTRINFQPYTSDQLREIVHKRLEFAQQGAHASVPQFIDSDAIKFAGMKVASVSGDARRILDICRRAVEVNYVTHQESGENLKTVKIPDIKRIIESMQNSPTAAYLTNCSEHEKIMLASVLKCIRKHGIEMIKWGELVHQHMIYSKLLPDDGESTRMPTKADVTLILTSLASSRAILIEDNAITARKGEDERKIMLLLEPSEVERVLGDVGGERWKNTLGAGKS